MDGWIDSVSLRFSFCGKSDVWMDGWIVCDTGRMYGWMKRGISVNLR